MLIDKGMKEVKKPLRQAQFETPQNNYNDDEYYYGNGDDQQTKQQVNFQNAQRPCSHLILKISVNYCYIFLTYPDLPEISCFTFLYF